MSRIESTTFLGKRSFHRLLQIGNGYSVCEHPVPAHWLNDASGSLPSELDRLDLRVLAVRSVEGEQSVADLDSLTTNHILVLFGPDRAHEAFGGVNGDNNRGE